MARALNAHELNVLRSEGQHTRLYLAVHKPATVFTAQVMETPASCDRLHEIRYYNGDTGYPNTLAGQSVYVGTEPGAWDKGILRLREHCSSVSGYMKVGETSSVQVAAGDYLTVVDEFSVWPRHVRITDDGDVYMDYDIEYTSQHWATDPVPVLGPHRVVWLEGSSVSVEFDASDSWDIREQGMGYSWSAPGGALYGGNTATPTVVYTSPGVYRVACTVTTALGGSSTGYRYVFVYDETSPPTTAFTLEGCGGSTSSGGWSFRIQMFDEATRYDIRDRAMVILFARDYPESVGYVDGGENIVAIGWIAGDSIEWNPDTGSVTFTVQGAHYWLQHIPGFPAGVEDYAGEQPSSWTQMGGLTVDKGLWHFLYWRTTLWQSTDITLTGDTRRIAIFDAPPDTLWNQIKRAAEGAILATPVCDRYSRLYVSIDPQYVPEGERGDIPVVMAITTSDWRDTLVIRRRVVSDGAQVDLSGVIYDGSEGTPIFSLAPGHVMYRYGRTTRLERLALSSQEQANTLAGLYLGRMLNPYPEITVPFAGNYRVFDIAPAQYGTLAVQSTDTVRGIELTNLPVIPRSVRYALKDGVLYADVVFEGASTATGSVVGDPPPEPPPLPPLDDPPPLPDPDEPPGTTVYDNPKMAFVVKGRIYRTTNFDDAQPEWAEWWGNLPTVGIDRLAIDPTNQYVYCQVWSTFDAKPDVYRAYALDEVPVWEKVIDTNNLPADLERITPSVEVTFNGYAYVYGWPTEPDTIPASGCTCGGGGSATTRAVRPVLVYMPYTGEYTWTAKPYVPCCPYHGGGSNGACYWSLKPGTGEGHHIIMPQATSVYSWASCGWWPVNGGAHCLTVTEGETDYRMADNGDITGNNDAPAVSGFGVVSRQSIVIFTQYHLYRASYTSSQQWTDITPDDWDDQPRGVVQAKLDDSMALVATNKRIYLFDGTSVSTVADADLLGYGGFWRPFVHDTNPEQWYVCAGGDVLATYDGGQSWANKTGNLSSVSGGAKEIVVLTTWNGGD